MPRSTWRRTIRISRRSSPAFLCALRASFSAASRPAKLTAITRSLPSANLAHHLLGVPIGVRVPARVRPERALLEGVVASALALLDGACDSRPSGTTKQ
jgi:hypothetical protein